jgi:hypothetical protein
MKKFIVAILAFLYISASTGATINLHYCMGKLVDWTALSKDTDKCGKCGMLKSNAKDKGCCKDEHKQINLEKDQKTAENNIQLVQLVSVAIPVSFIEIPCNDFTSISEANPTSNAPPRSSSVAVYIRNCVFRI